MPSTTRVAVILAGGSGERFWPLSTPDRPKQLLKLSGSERTLLEEALDRAEPIFGRDHVYIVTGPRIGPAIAGAGLIAADHVLIEPEPKNTLGALVWAAHQLQVRGYPDLCAMAVLTADHAIGDGFRETVEDALALAVETGGLVTIGVRPTRPETGYGYIEMGAARAPGFEVRRFAEKPSIDVATEYVASGNFLWNSGMFFWTISSFLSELRKHVPHAAAVLEELPGDLSAFSRLPRAAIDKELMERSDHIFVVPARFPWDDVGSWDSLERTSAPDERGNVLVGNAVALDSSDCIVYSDGIPLGVLGVSDLIVVATPNGVLVCHKSEAQRVKEVMAALNGS